MSMYITKCLYLINTFNSYMKTENKNPKPPDNDWVAYIPDKEWFAFQNLCDELEQTREEFQKAIAGAKTLKLET